MRPSVCLFLVAAIVGLAGNSPADPAKPRPVVGANEVEVRLEDGSAVRMLLLQPAFEVSTPYGKLTVPTADVRRVEFGLHLEPAVARQIEDAVKNLGSDEYKLRDDAGKKLVALGAQAYPAVLRASRSNDLETARAAKTVLKRLREKLPENKLTIKGYDVLHTVDSPVTGLITNPALKARSPIFGEVDLKVSELRAIRWLAGGIDTEVLVDASKYAAPNEQKWMDSGVEVSADVSLSLQASGEVDLNPQGGNGQFICGPTGWMQDGRNGRHRPGSLVGKIGQNGKPFLVGDKYETTPTEDGRLYFLIGPSPWGVLPSGEFKVRILTNR